MNAPANIMPPDLKAHAETVLQLLPETAGRELELRARMLRMRNSIELALCRRTAIEEGADLLEQVRWFIGAYALAPLSEARLEALFGALRLMMRAVAHLDQFAEGDGARG